MTHCFKTVFKMKLLFFFIVSRVSDDSVSLFKRIKSVESSSAETNAILFV